MEEGSRPARREGAQYFAFISMSTCHLMGSREDDCTEKTVKNLESQETIEAENGEPVTCRDGDKAGARSSKHKRDMKGDDFDHRSKRSKSRNESRGTDTGRGSSRHRLSLRDGERSDRDQLRSSRDCTRKHRDQKERKERDRDREWGRDKKREREQERDRDRDSEKDHDHINEREKDREHYRSYRNRPHLERHLDERDRQKSKDRQHKGKECDKEDCREIDPDSRQHKKEEFRDPVVGPERDQRTVFIYQITLKADEKDVYEFFSRAGKVRDVRLLTNRNSRPSKGIGYVEFVDAMSIPMAIALSGKSLLGQPVMVIPSKAEKNLVQSTVTGAATEAIDPYSAGAKWLYVGNLHLNMKEDQLRQVFEPFGKVELVQLPTESETGLCKGFGFIQFARLEDARAAQSLDGQLEIAGQLIKVSAVTDQTEQELSGNTGGFDADEGGGLALNAHSRALMQKLDRGGTSSSDTGSLPIASILGTVHAVPPVIIPSFDLIGAPSECLLLKNMFDPKVETEADFDIDVKDDVNFKCSRFGTVRHIYVDKNSAGSIYLRFENTDAATTAQRALNGRWFAGKMITATFMVTQKYEAKFPDGK